MLRPITLAFVLALGADVAAAATVRYDVDSSIDVSTWKTFAWTEPEPTTGATLAEARIRRSVTAGLADKGYAHAGDPAAADFLIEAHAGARRRLRVDESWSPGFGRDLRVGATPEGFLVVDLIDRRTGRLAWRGAVSDALESDPDKADARAAKAVAKLFKKLPSAAAE